MIDHTDRLSSTDHDPAKAHDDHRQRCRLGQCGDRVNALQVFSFGVTKEAEQELIAADEVSRTVGANLEGSIPGGRDCGKKPG